MEVITLSLGEQQTNCYLLIDEATQKTIIIDPADEADFISTTILEKKLVPEAILLTHGHYDHCMGVLELKLNFNIPIFLHKDDLFLYKNANKSSSFWSKNQNRSVIPGLTRNPSPILKLPPINHFLTDNQIITFGESSLKVVHTPGHTPGSCCFVSPSNIARSTAALSPARLGQSSMDSQSGSGRGNPSSHETYLFTGDTLFATGPGAVDRAYSSKKDLQTSLSRLRSETSLPAGRSVSIYPGHEVYGTMLNL